MAASGARVQPATTIPMDNQVADYRQFVCNPLRMWNRLQVSYYGGKYSIERVLALEQYTRTTSMTRVVLVCFGTPVPMIVLAILQEMIPLQEPAEGWQVQYGFWIRVWILACQTGHTITNQARFLIDGVVISETRLAVLSVFAAVLFTVVAAFIAAYLVFPVPFFVCTLAPLFYLLLVISYRIIIGGEILRVMVTHSTQLFRYIIFVCAQVMIACVYPMYESLFRAAEGSRYQLLVILLLPVIKIAVKNMILRCSAHREDMTPEAVIFTVDFFNSLYVATCMQSASSLGSIMAITMTDLLQTSVMLYGLHRRTDSIRAKLCDVTDIATDKNVLAMLCSLCRIPETFKTQCLGINIHSCLPHTVSEEDEAYLERLEKKLDGNHPAQNANSKVAGPILAENQLQPIDLKKPRSICAHKRIDSVHPIVPHPPESTKTGLTSWTKHAVLCETLESLFTTECIVVAAYVEAIVPLFYCNYIVVMVHLSSSRYHTEMVGITSDNVNSTVRPVLIFGLLQLVCFALLAIVIKRNSGMKLLYQLGFVLETQMSLIQGKLMLWMIITFCFRVVHFGMDFTFQFAWIGRQTTG